MEIIYGFVRWLVQNWIILSLSASVTLLLLMFWCCCIAAGRADDQSEKLFQLFMKEKEKTYES